MSRWVLVVEDEPALGEMLCDNLRSSGYEAELARSGTAARDRIAKGGLDLVLLDIMLPGINGFEVLEHMRSQGDNTPVLILSARIGDADRIRGLELKADDYLTKPFNLKELLLRVDALLRRNTTIPSGSDILEFSGNRIDFRSHSATTVSRHSSHPPRSSCYACCLPGTAKWYHAKSWSCTCSAPTLPPPPAPWTTRS